MGIFVIFWLIGSIIAVSSINFNYFKRYDNYKLTVIALSSGAILLSWIYVIFMTEKVKK